MKKKFILITGCAGFIGFHLTKALLKMNYHVIGIDNINSYYNLKLKKLRLQKLKHKNFSFKKIDLCNRKKLFINLKKFKIKKIIHLAAQPGVRYSLAYPETYIQNNILAFSNIIDYAKNENIDFIYASSSSVYGETKKYPIKENTVLKPKNIYALTKKNNEEIAELYYQIYKMKSVGLRFFTVFGEYGRPDMLFLKFFSYILKKKVFPVYNKGNYFRDFTYIDDLISMLIPVVIKYGKLKKKNHVFNLCSGKSIKLSLIIDHLKKITGYKKIKLLPHSKIEIIKTHGDNKAVMKISKKLLSTHYKLAINNTYSWFKKNKKIFL